MQAKERVLERINEHIEMFSDIYKDYELQKQVIEIAEKITTSLQNGGRLLLCGNGGSASDAQHIAAEFVGRFQKDRKAYDAEALTVNTSTLTAVGNDYGFEEIFSRQVEAKGRKNDVLIGISTSGKSKDVIKAIETARNKEMLVIMLMGDYELDNINEFCDYAVKIPSKITARIQEGHIFVGHVLAELIEQQLTKNS